MIKVAVCGAAGRMGKEVVKAVSDDAALELVGAIDKNAVGSDSGEVAGIGKNGVMITSNPNQALSQAEVMVDFTHPTVVMNNIKAAIEANVNVVVGTTGITSENLETVKSWLTNKDLGVFIAPNFAIGAVIMMELAKKAAKYFPNIEIIELHHNQKADAPSGTALKTAQDLGKIIGSITKKQEEKVTLPGSRGGEQGNIHIHSVRLPGFVAHQEIIFGGQGQTLKIRHDSIDRNSFMPGVLMAIKVAGKRKGLTYGLENLLDI